MPIQSYIIIIIRIKQTTAEKTTTTDTHKFREWIFFLIVITFASAHIDPKMVPPDIRIWWHMTQKWIIFVVVAAIYMNTWINREQSRTNYISFLCGRKPVMLETKAKGKRPEKCIKTWWNCRGARILHAAHTLNRKAKETRSKAHDTRSKGVNATEQHDIIINMYAIKRNTNNNNELLLVSNGVNCSHPLHAEEGKNY